MLSTYMRDKAVSLLSWGLGSRQNSASSTSASAAVAHVGHAYSVEEFVITSPLRPALGSAPTGDAATAPNALGVVPHVATTQVRYS